MIRECWGGGGGSSDRREGDGPGRKQRVEWRELLNAWLRLLWPRDNRGEVSTPVEQLREGIARSVLFGTRVAVRCATVVLVVTTLTVLVAIVGTAARVVIGNIDVRVSLLERGWKTLAFVGPVLGVVGLGTLARKAIARAGRRLLGHFRTGRAAPSRVD